MTKASDNPFPSILLEDHVDPTAPADGFHRLFIDTDEKLKMIDHASLVTDFTPGAGTTVATDAIWDAAGDLAVGTGADTAAVLGKGAAGGVLAMGNSAVIWNAGTSFPASKATNDRYWRTDLGMEFYWDGTRWVSVQLFEWATSVPDTAIATGGSGLFYPLLGTTFGLWLVDFRWVYQVATTHDAGKYWSVALHSFKNGTDATVLTLTSDKATVGAYVNPAPTAIGAAVATDQLMFYAIYTKTSTPGNLIAAHATRYRIIGT